MVTPNKTQHCRVPALFGSIPLPFFFEGCFIRVADIEVSTRPERSRPAHGVTRFGVFAWLRRPAIHCLTLAQAAYCALHAFPGFSFLACLSTPIWCCAPPSTKARRHMKLFFFGARPIYDTMHVCFFFFFLFRVSCFQLISDPHLRVF